ncbi:hypothetical protein GCM10027051_32400 [Niabella terrae]
MKASYILKSSYSKIKVEISSIKKVTKPVPVYNIEVGSDHNYFIANSTILVHNKNITEINETHSDGCSPVKNKSHE